MGAGELCDNQKRHPVENIDDGGLLENAKEHGIAAIFCGHDHHSDCVYRQGSMLLGYGRCGSFFPPSEFEGKQPMRFARGSRLFELSLDEHMLRTWITEEGAKSLDCVSSDLAA